MDADDLLTHALTSLPEAVGDLLRAGRDPREFIFASFDGASRLGIALIASDPERHGRAIPQAQHDAERLVRDATRRGEELVVSLMVTKDVLYRLLHTSDVEAQARVQLAVWLEMPTRSGHFRVVAISGEHVRAATVDGVADADDAPVSSSLLN